MYVFLYNKSNYEQTAAKEVARQELHTALREACNKGDIAKARAILQNLGTECDSIINSSPSGSGTLLFRLVIPLNIITYNMR